MWLGVGALTLGLGTAALAGGAGDAHADSARGTSPTHSVGANAKSAAHPAAAHAVASAARQSVSSPATSVHKSSAAPAAAVAQAPKTVTANATVSPVPPLGVVAKLIGNALLSLGGMDPANPTPKPNRPVQALLYRAAAVIENTLNPKGIPVAGPR